MLLAAVLVLAGLIVYANSFAGAFILDDLPKIVENDTLRQLAPITSHLRGTRPLVNLSLALNYAVSGRDPVSYHVFNLVIHLAAGLALFGLVRRTLQRPTIPERFRRAANGLAFAIALLWLVHPLQTESVTYVIQRAESMMGLFYLLTLYGLVRCATADRPGSRWIWAVVAALACVCGMASKPIMVTAPLVALIYDRVFLATSWRQLGRQRWFFYLLLAAPWLMLFVSGTLAGVLSAKPRMVTVGFGYLGFGAWDYLRSQPLTILHYLRLSVWPYPQSIDYWWPLVKDPAIVVVTLAAVLALVGITLYLLWRKPAAGFLGVWFLVILAPTSSIVPLQDTVVEHRMYLSLAAVVVAVVLAGYALLCRLTAPKSRLEAGVTTRVSGGRGGSRPVAVGLLVVVAAALGARTLARNADYHDPVAMWAQVLAMQPDHSRAHNQLGYALAEKGDYEQAIEHYRQSIAGNPQQLAAYNNLALSLIETDRYQEARQACLQGLEQVGPGSKRAQIATLHNNLANACLILRNYHLAETHYAKALKLRPSFASAHMNLGVTYKEQGQYEQALAEFDQALALDSNLALAYYNRGSALMYLMRMKEAIAPLTQAARLLPDHYLTRLDLATVLAAEKRCPEAAAHFAMAMALDPNNAEPYFRRGLMHYDQGQRESAIEDVRRALQLNPDHQLAHQLLAKLQATEGNGG